MRVYLQDCIETVIDNRGVTPHKRGTEWQDSGVMVLSANNVKTTGLQNMDQVRYIPDEIYDSWMKIPLERGDIILTSEAPAGEVYYWDSDEKVVLGQRLYGLKIKNSINSKYLKYYLQSEVGQKAIRQQQSGSTVFGISASTFQNIVVELPSKSAQDRIAQILSAIDDRITNNNAICAELEAMAKLLYDYWFVQFDFPDENGKPYKSSGGKMVWSEELKREIPEGWEIKCCSDILDVVTGKEDANFATEDGQYAFFTCGSDILKCNTYKFDGKMILLAGNGDFNVKCFEGKCNAYQRTYVLMPREEKHIGLLYQSVLRAIAALKKGSAGSIVKFITKSDVENIKLLIPHDDAMLDSFNKVFSFAEHIKKENAELSSLRDFLLPLLMNGQVVVNSDE